jgi:hypothetical protein
MQALDGPLSALLPRPYAIDSLCLLGQDKTERFHLISRVNLGA